MIYEFSVKIITDKYQFFKVFIKFATNCQIDIHLDNILWTTVDKIKIFSINKNVIFLVQIKAKLLKCQGNKLKKNKMQIDSNIINYFSMKILHKQAKYSDIEWVSLPGGEYLMGSPEDELYRKDDETQHLVSVLPYKISKHTITVHQFNEFIEATNYITDSEKGTDEEKGSYVWKGYSSKLKSGTNWRCNERGRTLSSKNFDHPVVHISWNDATAFAEWKGCRLPTEAEWEFACHAGTMSPFNTGYELKTKLANYKPDNNNSKRFEIEFNNEILSVGKFSPNAFGLYDMHGNVSEWCNDYYAPYPSGPQINPIGPVSGEFHVVRGGSWLSHMRNCRSARRNRCKPDESIYDIGFRVAL